MSRRKKPNRKKTPYKVVKRRSKQNREEWLKELSKRLEHDKELEVAVNRLKILSHEELEARQTKYLRSIVAAGKSQQAFLHVANMTPEQFRDFIIDKLTHNHS